MYVRTRATTKSDFYHLLYGSLYGVGVHHNYFSFRFYCFSVYSYFNPSIVKFFLKI